MARKKLSVVRTKKYKKLVRLLAVFAVIVLVAGLIAYGWQKHEEEKYPEGTEKDYSLPNAFIDFARPETALAILLISCPAPVALCFTSISRVSKVSAI